MIILIENISMKRFISVSNPKQCAVSSPLIVMHLCVYVSVGCVFVLFVCVCADLFVFVFCGDVRAVLYVLGRVGCASPVV